MKPPRCEHLRTWAEKSIHIMGVHTSVILEFQSSSLFRSNSGLIRDKPLIHCGGNWGKRKAPLRTIVSCEELLR